MRTVDLNIGINAIGNFESPMRKFQGLTEDSLAAVSRFGRELKGLGDQQESIRGLRNVEAQLNATNTQRQKALTRVKELSRAIEASEKPTKRQLADLERTQRQLGRLAEKHRELKTEAGKRRQSLRGMGIDTRKLADEQQRLGMAYAESSQQAKRFGEVQRRALEANARFDNMSQRAANAALIGGAVSQHGRGILSAVSSPLESAIAFEDAMADVNKFVKGANIEELSAQIRELGGSSPIGSVGVAALVAAGGKINLSAEESLSFAQMAEKQAVAYGISVDQAADTITTIRTGMNLTIAEMQELGNAINYIGDNSGSTAPKINNIVSRIGAVGKSAGLADAEIAGLAAVIDAGAPNVEIAATSMKNILTTLTSGEHLGGTQRNILEDLGFDARELAASMQENATATIEQVLKAIAGEDAADRNGIISALFGRESQAAVANMVGNLQGYRKVMAMTAERAYANSVQNEYAEVIGRSSTQLQVARQKWENVKIQLGEKLLPVLVDIIDTMKPVVQGISAFIEKNPNFSKWLMIGAAGVGALAVALSPVVVSLYGLAAAIAWLNKSSRSATASLAAQKAGGVGIGGGGGRGRLGKWGKGAGIAGAGIGTLAMASTLMDDDLTSQEKLNSVASTGGGMAGAWGGAKAGAMLGAFLGPLGIAAGGIIGGAVGYAAGNWLGDKLTRAQENDEQTRQAIGRMAKAREFADKPVVAAPATATVNDNSVINMTVSGTEDPEKTAEIVVEKLAQQQRWSRRRQRGQLYDLAGDVPA